MEKLALQQNHFNKLTFSSLGSSNFAAGLPKGSISFGHCIRIGFSAPQFASQV